MKEVFGGIVIVGIILYWLLRTGRRNRKREFAILARLVLLR